LFFEGETKKEFDADAQTIVCHSNVRTCHITSNAIYERSPTVSQSTAFLFLLFRQNQRHEEMHKSVHSLILYITTFHLQPSHIYHHANFRQDLNGDATQGNDASQE